MEYKTFMIGFRKPSGKEYEIRVMAESDIQALRIAYSQLSDKLGDGDFYIMGEKEN